MVDQWSFIENTARALGVKTEALRKWRIRGVPAAYRLPIADEATRSGFSLDRNVFDEPPGPKTKLAAE
jgi:hypothetical protein